MEIDFTIVDCELISMRLVKSIADARRHFCEDIINTGIRKMVKAVMKKLTFLETHVLISISSPLV